MHRMHIADKGDDLLNHSRNSLGCLSIRIRNKIFGLVVLRTDSRLNGM
jgi:hypothetical protein